MWQYAIQRWHFYINNFLQRRPARILLFERATGINYRPIGNFGTNASFEVIFQNQDTLVFLRHLQKKVISKIDILICHPVGVSGHGAWSMVVWSMVVCMWVCRVWLFDWKGASLKTNRGM